MELDGHAFVCCDLDLWPFDPKIWSAHLWTQMHLRPKLGKTAFTGFWDVVFSVHNALWHTDSLTHSHTDGQTRLQNASGIVFQQWRGRGI